MLNRVAQIESEVEWLFRKMEAIELQLELIITENNMVCDLYAVSDSAMQSCLAWKNQQLEREFNMALMDYDFLEESLEYLGAEYDALVFVAEFALPA